MLDGDITKMMNKNAGHQVTLNYTQIALAAATMVQASAGSGGVAFEKALKNFDQAFDHILAKTRPTG